MSRVPSDLWSRRRRRFDTLPDLVGRVPVLLSAAVAAVLLLGLCITGPAAAVAPPDDRRAGVFHLWFSGVVAQATWSTCGEEPIEGDVCTSTDLMAFLSSDREQAGSEYQLHNRRSPVVKIFQGSCKVRFLDGDLLCVPLQERFGRSTTGTVTVSPRLGAVTAVAADLPVQLWSPEDGDSTGTLDVTATWTGSGELVRLDERAHVADRDLLARSGTRGWQRGCTVAAEVDDGAPPGELVYCELLDVRQTDLRVLHGPDR